ncbi:MAG: hypothetical protein ACTSU4_11360 [Promethearchaeota archaeon]
MIKIILKETVHKFELLYGPILKDWDGDLSIFESVGQMIKEVIQR